MDSYTDRLNAEAARLHDALVERDRIIKRLVIALRLANAAADLKDAHRIASDALNRDG